MNILLISQCDKRALTQTRRILDQFAERRGDRTWQTPITQDGLDTLRRLLRTSARKNTAVACHWIRGIDHSELLWVVGDRSRFNAQGAVPTNTTTRDVLRAKDEDTWQSAGLIRLLADLAGLLHDLGKATQAFQMRLSGNLEGKNLIRHEWVSLRLLESFVGSDPDAQWLQRLAAPTAADDAAWLTHLRRDHLDGPQPSPFKALAHAPLAAALGWLVVTHHRLPQLPHRSQEQQVLQPATLVDPLQELASSWNEDACLKELDAEAFRPYWTFPHGLPMVTQTAWRQRASRVARGLLQVLAQAGPAVQAVPADAFVMHLSRLCLMLADHHYSSLQGSHPDRVKGAPGFPLWANTTAQGGRNQGLDEHLVGVAQLGALVGRFLPQVAQNLPHLGEHPLLKKRAKLDRFRWQDRAAELAGGLRDDSRRQGAFIVNMASTGCGKTLGNARMMYALADPAVGMRCAFAMGLRTLTLQTGRAFRDMLRLDDDQLAVRVGGSASQALFEFHEARAEKTGSASQQALLDEDGHVDFGGAVDADPLLRRAVADPTVRKLLVAPLLVCTIDHLAPATESQRGGRQIAPMLRLLSGDLVLDEPDDFDLSDLPALTRLVNWAGLLGARVLLSSATLPPALVHGLFEAYRQGRQLHQRHCADRPGQVAAQPVCCAWVDEFQQQAQPCGDGESFLATHQQFAQRRHARLAQEAASPRRRAALWPWPAQPLPSGMGMADLAADLAAQLMQAAGQLHHHHHSIDPVTGRRVSFGLVRLANIEPLFELALALYQQVPPAGVQLHVCVYHARHPQLVRSAIEHELDATLQRHKPEAVFSRPSIRQRLDATEQPDHLFIVLGSPVTEVGRDHCYDWAVVEPSSMRSFIQLCGRVRRHHGGPVTEPNILILQHNLRSQRSPQTAAFCWPGFEGAPGSPFSLRSHDMKTLLRPEELPVIDARPRLCLPAGGSLEPQRYLSDLEHARLQHDMLPRSSVPPPARTANPRARALAAQSDAPAAPAINASSWWQAATQRAQLTALLQQKQPFRKTTQHEVTVARLPDEDGDIKLHQLMGPGHKKLYRPVEGEACVSIDDGALQAERVAPWAVPDYETALSELAESKGLSLRQCAERFGTVTVPESAGGWRYHPMLGFAKGV
ncbi:type I-F CRISPR-associated helicase Cas3f [Ideonella livida]|uniref:Type I-F CRISPR-associated helicase Cas3 n=1 Tax=Ideonella livida TaxID=2707176 RepID=A0A7C9PKI1_9BURK|nr:type I-F CRISPR-associated helicase Cas3f [Ideonella livida]NDY93312.1 type I-F CRISPR-associated helicase Cas3 [Ideonella livida]